MNRNEILAASDEQLNEWCATEAMGWMKVVDQWDGSVSFHRPKDPPTTLAYYEPTDDLTQAIGLLDRLRETLVFEWELSTLAKYKKYLVTIWWGGFTNFACHEDDSKTRAIVIACLLAVVEMEQETVTP